MLVPINAMSLLECLIVFDNDQPISVLVGGNNINSPGFSFGEIEKMFGGGNAWFRDNGFLASMEGNLVSGKVLQHPIWLVLILPMVMVKK